MTTDEEALNYQTRVMLKGDFGTVEILCKAITAPSTDPRCDGRYQAARPLLSEILNEAIRGYEKLASPLSNDQYEDTKP